MAGLVALVLLAGSAAAMRKPTGAEQKAIRQAVNGFIRMPNSPASPSNRIAAISVSTVDSRYAGVLLTSGSVGPSSMVLHRSFGTWWVVGFGSSLGCDTAPKSVLNDLKIGCMPPPGVAWISNCGPLVSKPADLILTCADANYGLSGLAWSGWGTGTATATGKAHANDCTPNCAAGHERTYRMTATASQLKTCGKARYYSRLTIVYPGARPAGIARRDAHTLPC